MHRLDAAQTYPAEPGDFDDLTEETGQVFMILEFESECAKMNARKNNLLKTPVHQRSDFSKHILRSGAPSRPAHFGDYAVRTMRIAAVLQLNKWASLPTRLGHGL
jgi:hypothetical protein